MLRVLHKLVPWKRRRVEERLQLALSAGHMATWERDFTASTTWWSEEMYGLHGLRAAEGVPEDYFALVHPDDRERVRQDVQRAIAGCGEHRIEYRVCWPDGTVHWIGGSGATLCDSAGQPEMMIGVCVGIDARKEEERNLQFLANASAELAALSDRAATLQRIAQLAVPEFADWCAVDLLEGTALRRVAVAHVDPAKVRMAWELHERFPPDPQDAAGTWAIVRSQQPQRLAVITREVLQQVVADPAYREALLALGLHSFLGVPLVAQGRVLGVISFVTSDSRRVFSERDLALAVDLGSRAAVAIQNVELLEALRRADTAKDVFLATLAHELRNPLAPIVNSLALLAHPGGEVAGRLERVLPVLQRQTAHLARLVDDLLDLGRINSGKIELRREAVNLREVLRSAVESVQPALEQRRHALAFELPGETVQVHGDAVRLAQVFGNLLHNAVRYTPPGGRIAVHVEADDQQVRVRVADTGIGIAASLLPRVFELFTQAVHPADSGHQGLGIGLFLVRGLVEMHGGRVWADSAGEGQGSSFTVELPRIAAVAAPPPQAGAAAAVRVPLRVLVVDDNVDAAATLAQLLELLGHQPATAHDGAAALRSFAQDAPEVVLLDIGLPDLDGYEVARRIRAQPTGGDVLLVALTGWGQSEDKRRAADAGFDRHWTKPVDPALLGELSALRARA